MYEAALLSSGLAPHHHADHVAARQSANPTMAVGTVERTGVQPLMAPGALSTHARVLLGTHATHPGWPIADEVKVRHEVAPNDLGPGVSLCGRGSSTANGALLGWAPLQLMEVANELAGVVSLQHERIPTWYGVVLTGAPCARQAPCCHRFQSN